MARLTPIWQRQPNAVMGDNDTIDASVLVDSATTDVVWDVLDQVGTSVYTAHATPVPYGGYYNLATLSVAVSQAVSVSGAYQLQAVARGGDETSAAAVSRFEVLMAPVVAITSPLDGSTVSTLPLVVTWTAEDSTGNITAQEVVLYDHDRERITAASIDPGVTSWSYDGSLENESTYSVDVQVRGGAGVSTTVTTEFATSWVAPDAPTIEVTADTSTSSVAVTATAEDMGVTVWRVNADGTRTQLANATGTAAATDLLAPLGVDVTYETRCVHPLTGAPSATVSATAQVAVKTWAFNAGDGTILHTLRCNPSSSYSMEQGGEAYHFADGGAGGGLPVWYGTDQRDESGSLGFDTDSRETVDGIVSLLMTYPVVWLRDPFGHRWRVNARPSWSRDVGKVWHVDIDWDAVRWREV